MGGGPNRISRKKNLRGLSWAAVISASVLVVGMQPASAEDDWLRDIRVNEGAGFVAHIHVPFTRFTAKQKPTLGVAFSGPKFIGTNGDLTKFTWDDSVLLNVGMSTSGFEGLNVGGIGNSALKEKSSFDPAPQDATPLRGITIGRGLAVKPWYGLGLQDEAPPPSPRLTASE